MKSQFIFLIGLAIAVLAIATDEFRPWMDANADPSLRAQLLLKQMTTQEKLNMVHGWSGNYVGNVVANSRLGIPFLGLEDGPQGVADGVTEVTAWPSALTVVCSWDRFVFVVYLCQF